MELKLFSASLTARLRKFSILYTSWNRFLIQTLHTVHIYIVRADNKNYWPRLASNISKPAVSFPAMEETLRARRWLNRRRRNNKIILGFCFAKHVVVNVAVSPSTR